MKSKPLKIKVLLFMIVIYFIYGLAFFTLGIATLFYPKKHSRFELAKTLSIISLFGIVHGGNEWIDMFKLIQKPTGITSLNIVGLIVLPISYFFLLLFGTMSLSQLHKKYSALNTLPILLFITWTIITTVSTQHFLIGNIWARYLLCVPGTFLSSYALILYVPYFKKNIPAITVNIKIAASAFFFYGIFSGIIVPEAGFFPASFINDTVFMNNVGIPIQVFRTFCAIALAYSLVSIVRIFNWETNQLHNEIAERKKLQQVHEKLLVELERKNKEFEQVINITSHDLRSPLVNIEGYSKELNYSLKELTSTLDNKDIPANVKEKIDPIVQQNIPESLRFIHKSVLKMSTLLKSLLTLSKLGRIELNIEDINMNEILSDIIANHKFRLKELGVNTEVSELPQCKGDRIQVNQLFSNILENAVKYLDPERPGIIKIIGYTKGDQSVYCVEDNGIGIVPEYQEKIFEIFHRLEPDKVKGEGLGLTIVHKIVERLQGRVWVESELGQGSKFFVSLPS
jgi:signal transduction histidine kinase